jgi:hypothetical protein
MKGNTHAKKNTPRRNRSYNRRIRHHHSRCSWLCGSAAGNPKVRRSQTNASGHNSFGAEFAEQLGQEQGSVTAEFAIVLPAVLLILGLSLQVLSFQSARVSLIELAAESARALARGEELAVVEKLVSEAGLRPAPTFDVIYKELELCVELNQSRPILGLGGISFKEIQCARKSGL